MHFYQNRNLIIKGESENLGNLWLGDFESARNKKSLRADKINAVVTAGLGMKITYTSQFKHKLLPLYDSQRQDILRFFQSSYDFIDDALKSGNVLIHCYAGISRSTTILTAYLMRKNNWKCRQTIAMIKKIRSVIQPNRGFMTQLRQLQARLNSKNQQNDPFNSKIKVQAKKQLFQAKKSFVQGFIQYKRDNSLFQRNGRNFVKQKPQQRSQTVKKSI